MLVCSVSLRPKRGGLTAEIVEALDAVDEAATGNVVFATLVDDPASVADIVDAFLGVIMLEAASATDSVTTVNIYDVAVAEAMTATDVHDGTISTGPSYNTWNLSDKTANISVSGLTVTTTTTSTGGIRSTGSKTSGKIYFEVAWTGSPGGARYTCGINDNSVSLLNLDVNGAIVRTDDGFIRINGAIQSSVGAFASGDVAGIAFDLGTSRAWFRRNGGTWNNSGTADPATNTGGYDISAMFPTSAALASVSTSTSTAIAATANFGATAFAFAAPSGFTGWTIP